MKLAEALQERSDLNKKIESLRNRLLYNATVQKGEKTAEDPKELKKLLDVCLSRLEELMIRINLTNCKTTVEGMNLTEMIAKKDTLLLKVSVYRNLVSEASRLTERVRGSEIKIISNVSVKELQEEVDQLSKEIRTLDNKLQAANWSTELL